MVVNAPTSNIISAAELTVGHVLSLARRIPAAHASLAQGLWKRSSFTGTELFEKTIGIIGLGRIGALIAARLQAFDMRVIAYDPYVTATRAQQLGVQLVSLDDVLEQSDFVTIHMPKTPETTGMIGTEQLRRMKSSAYVINVARGGLIDEDALFEALTSGEIAGAGLDVFSTEPPAEDGPARKLLDLPNVVVTPHLGASTDEAQEKAGVSVARSVKLALEGDLVPDAVEVVWARPIAPIGFDLALRSPHALVRFTAVMAPEGADSLWRVTIATDGARIDVEFPPPFVHTGSARTTVRDGRGIQTVYPIDRRDGYDAEWRALAALLRGETAMEYDELRADAAFVIAVADGAAAAVRAGVVA
jgi:phosphoglycerate dehydrogenase-like enzyme